MRILVSMAQNAVRDTFIPDAVRSEITAAADEVIWNTLPREFSKDELKEALKGVYACLCGWHTPIFDEETLEFADQLKVIAYTGGSLAGVVAREVYRRGIQVLGGNYAFGESVAEGALCYMLAMLREIPRYATLTREGGWRRDNFFNRGLLDRTVGIIGFGASGRALATLLEPFRVKLLVYDPYVDKRRLPYFARLAELDELCAQCDVISIHAPNARETQHMIGAAQLSLMKDGCVFVNTARGSLVDEAALITALSSRPIFAALDVTDPEPPAADSPLRKLPNAMLIPHMAGPTVDRRAYITHILLEDILSIKDGKKPGNAISQAYAGAMSKD